MSGFHVEQLAGLVNGANTVFSTPQPYIAGSLTPLVYGLPSQAAELGGSQIRLAIPPLPGGHVAAMYRSTEVQVGRPAFETPAGAVDGLNQLFTLSAPYTAGRLAVWIDGVLRRQQDTDGWAETDPTAGQFTMSLILPVGSTVEAWYLDTTAAERVGVTPIMATVVETKIVGQVD